jgi:hypothetical protein
MMNLTTTTRRRLFTRLEGDLPPLRLTERDVRILQRLYEYRFLTMPQLHALLAGSKRYLTERLSRLYHHGYVDRPRQQIALRIFGFRHVIYALAQSGAQFLAAYFENPEYLRPRWTANNLAVQAPQFVHQLMLSQFRICLTVACRNRADVSLTKWESPEVSLMRYVMEGRKVLVKPDAYFVLTSRAEDGVHEGHFFLEVDRGTMTHGDIQRKLAAYWRMRTERRLIPDWVPKAYRVLTVSASAERAANLIEVGKNADPRHAGSLLFYFCSEDDYALDWPELLFGKIWRSPADKELHSLLERKEGGHARE